MLCTKSDFEIEKRWCSPRPRKLAKFDGCALPRSVIFIADERSPYVLGYLHCRSLLYIYAIWRIAHTWAGRSQINLLAWFVFLGLAGGGMGLIFQAATHRPLHPLTASSCSNDTKRVFCPMALPLARWSPRLLRREFKVRVPSRTSHNVLGSRNNFALAV